PGGIVRGIIILSPSHELAEPILGLAKVRPRFSPTIVGSQAVQNGHRTGSLAVVLECECQQVAGVPGVRVELKGPMQIDLRSLVASTVKSILRMNPVLMRQVL